MRLIQTLLIMLMPVMALAYTPSQVMEKASERVRKAPALTAMFTATSSEGGTAKGVLSISKKRFTMTGSGYGIWYDGTDMWSYSQATGETNITTPTEAELLETNPLEIINHYKDNFTVTKEREGAGKYTVSLKARSKANSVRSALLTIDTKTWLPTAIDVTFSNNTSLAVTIDSITEANTLPGKIKYQYPASDYPGVDVIDLR